MQASAALAPLQFSVSNIKRHLEKFISLGLLSPLPMDDTMLGIEQVV